MKPEIIGPGKCYLDYGPMQLLLEGYRQNKPLEQETLWEAAGCAKGLLAELSSRREMASCRWPQLEITAAMPDVLQRMHRAVSSTGDGDLTPMAAVAGANADCVADFLLARGATRVIANNGGDIALRQLTEEKIRVGIVSELMSGGCSHYLELSRDEGIGGIAASGFGGRSLTRGAASAVVTLGKCAADADAAATLVANHTICESSRIVQLPAEFLDPDTDIRGQHVTVQVGSLNRNEKEEALRSGMAVARRLVENSLIKGAILFVQSEVRTVPRDWSRRCVPIP